jgi:hypothetical protein
MGPSSSPMPDGSPARSDRAGSESGAGRSGDRSGSKGRQFAVSQMVIPKSISKEGNIAGNSSLKQVAEATDDAVEPQSQAAEVGVGKRVLCIYTGGTIGESW